VRKSKDGGNAGKKKDTKKEDWKEICRDCEILKKGNNCFYGCEIIKDALKERKNKRE
jgi:hypothetical protein